MVRQSLQPLTPTITTTTTHPHHPPHPHHHHHHHHHPHHHHHHQRHHQRPHPHTHAPIVLRAATAIKLSIALYALNSFTTTHVGGARKILPLSYCDSA